MDMSALHKLLSEANLLIGVGPRGLMSFFMSVLVKGQMKDPRAQETYSQCEELEEALLQCRIPRVASRRLGCGGGGAHTLIEGGL